MKEIASYRININGVYSHIYAMSNGKDIFALFLTDGDCTHYEDEESLLRAFTSSVAHYSKLHFGLLH